MKTIIASFLLLLAPLLGYCDDGGPRVGLALLPLLHPRFPVAAAKDVVSKSDRPTVSFLYGPFGRNPMNLFDLVKGLSGEPHVQIYVLSGPTRTPRAKIRGMQDFYKSLPIPHFNRRLANDSELQESFRERIETIRTSIVNRLPGIQFVIVPELEDNLTKNGRAELVRIIGEAFAGYGNVTIRTNPLPLIRTPGLPVESHDPKKIKKLSVGDSFSEDGLKISNHRTQKLLEIARLHGADYYIWRCEWQGTCDGQWRSPDRRTYKMRNRKALVRFITQP